MSETATERDRSGSSSLTPVEDGGILLIRACGLRASSFPTPGVGLSGLVPRPESAVLSGLPVALFGFSRFSHTQATYEDERPLCFF